MSRSVRNTAVCTAIMVVGAIIVALIVSSLWPSGEFPQSQAGTTVAPTTAEPAGTAVPTTAPSTSSIVAELPDPSADSRQIVNLNDLAASLQSELAAIPADQTALRAQKLAEYTKVRGLKSDAELEAVTKSETPWYIWVMLLSIVVMLAFAIPASIYSIRHQKRMEAMQREALGLGESIDSTPATPSQPPATKPARQDLADFLADGTTEETSTGTPKWHAEFDRFYHAQTPEVQAWMWGQRRSWPAGQETSRWAQLKARLLEAAAS